MNNTVCDNCTSDDIEIFHDESKEMDCYCNNCEEENYTVSSWWLSKGKWLVKEYKGEAK